MKWNLHTQPITKSYITYLAWIGHPGTSLPCPSNHRWIFLNLPTWAETGHSFWPCWQGQRLRKNILKWSDSSAFINCGFELASFLLITTMSQFTGTLFSTCFSFSFRTSSLAFHSPEFSFASIRKTKLIKFQD